MSANTAFEKPELLAPAGTMESLRAAIHFGADAVYGGMKHYGLRAFAGNFSAEELREAVALTHSAKAKFYVTMNIFPFDDQLDGFVCAARDAVEAGVDAAIVSDLGAVLRLRREVPELKLHISTQASTVNSEAVSFYESLGCERVILAREVSIDRAAKIREATGGRIQLETFVHGAACMAWSGRCLLSAELTGRSGNQGACAQPCRWKYAVMEEKRPGTYMPVSEDENGTYIFSAHDLNLMPLLPKLCGAGISSLKIEGRMKTAYYVGTVVSVYRRALDLLAVYGEERFRSALPAFMDELACASHRLSDTGFACGAPKEPGGAEGYAQTREFIAAAAVDAAAGMPADFILRNRFFAGDELELLTPEGPRPFIAPAFVRASTGETLDTFGIAGEHIRMQLPFAVREGDILRGPVRNHRKA